MSAAHSTSSSHHGSPDDSPDDSRAREVAFAALSHLPNWPATLDLAMEQPLPAALIRLAAGGYQRGAWNVGLSATGQRRQAMPMTARAETRPSLRIVYGLPLPSTAPVLDHKMRAAGEREED